MLTPTSSPDVPNHAAHFRPGIEQLQTPQQFNQQLVTLLATFPVGSSSGGFTFTFNPTLGTFSRSSDSFGPLFAERALTIGRNRGSLGIGFQRSTYDTFEGKNLRQRENAVGSRTSSVNHDHRRACVAQWLAGSANELSLMRTPHLLDHDSGFNFLLTIAMWCDERMDISAEA